MAVSTSICTQLPAVASLDLREGEIGLGNLIEGVCFGETLAIFEGLDYFWGSHFEALTFIWRGPIDHTYIMHGPFPLLPMHFLFCFTSLKKTQKDKNRYLLTFRIDMSHFVSDLLSMTSPSTLRCNKKRLIICFFVFVWGLSCVVGR